MEKANIRGTADATGVVMVIPAGHAGSFGAGFDLARADTQRRRLQRF
jgi:hypothetical protein